MLKPKLNVLYVTSFAADMSQSGSRLIESYFDSGNQSQSDFLVCLEDCSCDFPVLKYDLNDSIILKEWLKSNEDIIPKELGGKASNQCNCSVRGKHSPHKLGCHYSWWNRNCSRWFRKIPSLLYAIGHQYDWYVWIDSDCVFTNLIPYQFYFKSYDMFYHFGQHRPKINLCVETGLFGFKNKKFITEIYDIYRTKKFKSLIRWDDSSVIQSLIESNDFNCVDIAKNSKVKNVVDDGELKNYISHKIGKHSELGIMR